MLCPAAMALTDSVLRCVQPFENNICLEENSMNKQLFDTIHSPDSLSGLQEITRHGLTGRMDRDNRYPATIMLCLKQIHQSTQNGGLTRLDFAGEANPIKCYVNTNLMPS